MRHDDNEYRDAINNFDTSIIETTNHLNHKWYMDSDTSSHITNNKNAFETIHRVKGRNIIKTR